MDSIQCVICLKIKSKGDFKPEHIFPSAMGGAITIHNVCSNCNTKLGEVIDQPFLSHGMIAYYRNLFNLTRNQSRRKGNIPNPFKVAIIGPDGNKYKAGFKDNKPTYEVIESLKIENDSETGRTIAKMIIPGNRIDDFESTFKKLARRQGFEILEYEIGDKVIHANAPLTVQIDTDNNTFILGCIKIAYETLMYFFPAYLEDPVCTWIRSTVTCGSIHENLVAILDEHHAALMDRYSEMIPRISGLTLQHHAVLIENVENIGLVCCVRVFNWFYPVLLSKNSCPLPQGSCIFVCNHAGKRIHESNLQHSYINVRLTVELMELNELTLEFIIKSGEEAFKKLDGSMPIYDRQGNIKYSDPYSMCLSFMQQTAQFFRWDAPGFIIDVVNQNLFVHTDKDVAVKVLSLRTDRQVDLLDLY